MFVTHLMTAAVFSAATLAAAQEAPPAPDAPTITVEGEKAAADEKVVCKFTSTGTMMRTRICMPQSEWKKAEASSADALKGLRDWQRVRCSMGTRC